MTNHRQTFRTWLLALTLPALVHSARAEDPAPLRLVGAANGIKFDEITVENHELRVRAADGTVQPVPRETRWRLDGDFRAQPELFYFSPPYDIVTLPGAPVDGAAQTRTYGLVWFSWNRPWSERQLRDGIAVLVWLVDGQPVRVWARPLVPRNPSSGDFACMFAVELADRLVQGAPAILLLGQDGFVTAAPRFEESAANAVLAAMHWGDVENLPRFCGEVRKINRRADRDSGALLHMAAEGGFSDALRLLLKIGGKPDLAFDEYRTALHEAARNGRLECAKILLASGARRNPMDAKHGIPLDRAAEHGHLDVATLLLAGETSSRGTEETLSLAVEQGNSVELENLLAQIGNRSVRKLSKESLASGAASGNPALMRSLLKGGVKAGTVVDGIPLLVTAAASGSAESVEALLAAGADVNCHDGGGVTALMAAAWTGNLRVIEVLLRSGADRNRTDRNGRVAFDHANAAGNEEVAAMLRVGDAAGDNRDRSGSSGGMRAPRVVFLVGAGTTPSCAADELDVPAEVRSTKDSLNHGGADSFWVQRETMPQASIDESGRVRLYDAGSTRIVSNGRKGEDRPWAVASLIVERNGRPSAFRIVRASDEAFARDVRDAVERYEFEPGRRGGEPVRARVVMYFGP